MGKSSSQDIIESLLGRGNSAPEAFVRQQWRGWMAMRPRTSPVRRDAMLALLAERARGRRVLPAVHWPHWLALLCGRLDGPAPRDQRGLRALAATFSLGLHLLGLLLLVWIALVRSSPLPPAQERVAVRLVERGQGSLQGEVAQSESQSQSQSQSEGGQAAPSSPSTLQNSAADSGDAPGVMPPRVPAPAALSMPELAEPGLADVPAVVEREVAQVQPAPQVLARPDMQMQASDPVMPVLAVVERQVPDALATPVGRAAPVMPPVTAAELAMPSLQVAEREVHLPQVPILAPVAQPRPVDLALPAMPMPAVVEREVASAMRAPALPSAPSMPRQAVTLPDVALPAVVEREIALAAAPPPVRAPAAAPALPTVALPGAGMTVREREVVVAGQAPPLVRPATAVPGAAALTMPSMPQVAVVEHALPMAADTPAGAAAGDLGARPTVATPASARDAGGTASAAAAAAASPASSPVGSREVVPMAGAGRDGQPGPAMPAAGSAQDWSRAAAGSDDWSAATGRGREAPEADDWSRSSTADHWTRQGLEAAGTWLRQPPPGHQPGRFDRYWVPNESLLAEWVRKGLTNIDIPLPGGSGRIRCVISLLQAGGGCGVNDPNMQDQPAQARAAPEIPFKPALQEVGGSP